jgi:hypothetical protein
LFYKDILDLFLWKGSQEGRKVEMQQANVSNSGNSPWKRMKESAGLRYVVRYGSPAKRLYYLKLSDDHYRLPDPGNGPALSPEFLARYWGLLTKYAAIVRERDFENSIVRYAEQNAPKANKRF